MIKNRRCECREQVVEWKMMHRRHSAYWHTFEDIWGIVATTRGPLGKGDDSRYESRLVPLLVDVDTKGARVKRELRKDENESATDRKARMRARPSLAWNYIRRARRSSISTGICLLDHPHSPTKLLLAQNLWKRERKTRPRRSPTTSVLYQRFDGYSSRKENIYPATVFNRSINRD